METVVSPADAELNLLTQWGDPDLGPRGRQSAIASVVFHVILLTVLAFLPPAAPSSRRQAPEIHHIVTPLIEPITELTQKAPNTGKVSKEFNAVESAPRPKVQAPATLPSTTRGRPVEKAAIPAPPAPKPAPVPPTPLPEAAKIDTVAKAPPKTELPPAPVQAPPPPPQIQVEEKPKSPFEPVGAPPSTPNPALGHIPLPTGSVTDQARQALHNGGLAAGGGIIVGDADAPGGGGISSGVNLPGAPGAGASQIQLLSDPMGVDFRAYLIRVLTTVKLHWLAVIPESVRMGRRGKVAIQFSIAHNGQVPKLVIASGSGTDSLDRAAVAGISASVPFPPLPADFKGDKIVLQFNFAYNSK